tara:strand:+ start:1306 stop:2523 length:1218 start_codon:yes stop_codon:yes gene_type:complete
MDQIKVGILGLGYVGLPIFLRVKKFFFCVGFDTNPTRINQLKKNYDSNKEFKSFDLKLTNSIYTSNFKDLKKCNFYIVTVPTPIYPNKKPDLRPLNNACKILKKTVCDNDVIFFESTVYPGLTKSLKKKYFKEKNIWFGYSPERINPGDKINTIKNIKKIISFENCPETIKNKITRVYKSITHNTVLSKSIEHAEMSKVIENIQRDINIAFMNEIFMLCKKLNLDFVEVIKLAKTKWNFLNFSPGLVGGHCLPIDPFYLYYLAKKKNYNAQFILAGRKVNDAIKNFIKIEIEKKIKQKKIKKILILGLSYKANVSDLRNSLSLQIYLELKKKYKNFLHAFDPLIDPSILRKLKIKKKINKIKSYDLVVPLTDHEILRKKFSKDYKKNKSRYFDLFNYFSKSDKKL